jgi:hypothetical protein
MAGTGVHSLDGAERGSIVLIDPRLNLRTESLQRLSANGAQLRLLQGDPVWFWRSKDNAALRAPGTRLLGVTGWVNLLVFRGLAAETRRHLRYEKFDEETGAFIWLVA